MGVGKVAGGIFRKIFGSIGWWFKWGIFSFFLIFLIANAISISIQEGSPIPAIKDIGSRFLYATQNLQETALEITENGGTEGIGDSLWTGIIIFSQIYIIWLWIKVLAKIIGASPFSNASQVFINYAFGVLLFFISQSIVLLIFSEPLIGQTKSDLFLTPIRAFGDIFKALPYLFKPIKKVADVVVGPGKEETINSTLNIVNQTLNQTIEKAKGVLIF